MASLSLKNIYKVYPNGFNAVKDFNLEIEDKEFIIFVGPSGCGKSTFPFFKPYDYCPKKILMFCLFCIRPQKN